jgi:hypothetical protein
MAAVALVGAAIIGTFAYQLGASHALARAAEAADYPAGPIPYGWHRPWGFGFLFPLFFIGFWFVIVRGLFWGGPWRRRWHAAGPYDTPQRFDEWHRHAHERMGSTGREGEARNTEDSTPDRRA